MRVDRRDGDVAHGGFGKIGEELCDDLERSWIPRLWHALCADIDTDDSQKEVMYRMIKDTMFPRPGMVGGAGMSGNQAAMAGMMGGLRL